MYMYTLLSRRLQFHLRLPYKTHTYTYTLTHMRARTHTVYHVLFRCAYFWYYREKTKAMRRKLIRNISNWIY